LGTNFLGYETVAPISSSTSLGSNIMPSSGADPQDWKYLFFSMPGSTARRFSEKRVCNPLWPTTGCREAVTESQVTDVVPKDELPPQYQQEAKTLDDSNNKLSSSSSGVTSGSAPSVMSWAKTLGPVAVLGLVGAGVGAYYAKR
jgi:hypothetical protein